MYLATTSVKGVVHIFELYDSLKAIDESEYKDYIKLIPEDEIGYINDMLTLDPAVKNKTAKLASIGSLVSSYFNSRWGMAKVKVNDTEKYCAFAEGNLFVGKVNTYGSC